MRYERMRTAALLLGAALGGFLNGILLQQLAQWHPTVGVERRSGRDRRTALSTSRA